MVHFDEELDRVSEKMNAKLWQLQREAELLAQSGSKERARRALQELNGLAREFTRAREVALRNIGAYAQGVLTQAEHAYNQIGESHGTGAMRSPSPPTPPLSAPPDPPRYVPSQLFPRPPADDTSAKGYGMPPTSLPPSVVLTDRTRRKKSH
jgi:hypothetical protein